MSTDTTEDRGPERLARLTPGELDPDQRTLYDAIVGGPRGRGKTAGPVAEDGGLRGPFNALLLSPTVGDAVQRVGAALRYGSHLPDRAREIATLLVAHHCRSAYEWSAHTALAARAGLTEAEIASMRTTEPSTADDVEAAVAAATLELLATGDLDDAQYRRAETVLGRQMLFELVTLVGYYRMLAGVLATFRVPG